MLIHSVSAASTPDPSQSTTNATQTNDMFLQLLMAQLKSQSPLNPVDPNQFVGQLVQFNTLNQLLDIHALLQQIAAGLNIPKSSTQSAAGGQ